MPPGALSDVKVVDLTQLVAGPYCTKLLADCGAEVIKVERPDGGDPARRQGPFSDDLPHPEKSALFLYFNTNKKSVTLNLEAATGRKILRELVKDADILVESYPPRVAHKLGVAYEEMERVNPLLVVTSITNFGQTGPYRDFKATELVAYALGGTMHHTGMPDREPQRLGPWSMQVQVGRVAAVATMGAFIGCRHRRVGGQHVDVAAMEVLAQTIDRGGSALTQYVFSGDSGYHRAAVVRWSILPMGPWPCKDGFVHFTAVDPLWWPRFCRMIDRPDLIDDPRFSPEHFYDAHLIQEIDALLLPWCLEHTKQEIMIKGQAEGFAVTAVNTVADQFTDPHLAAREAFVEIDHPVAGRFKYLGAPFKMAKTPWRAGRAPLLGEHNEEVYGRLGYTKEALTRLRERGVI